MIHTVFFKSVGESSAGNAGWHVVVYCYLIESIEALNGHYQALILQFLVLHLLQVLFFYISDKLVKMIFDFCLNFIIFKIVQLRLF